MIEPIFPRNTTGAGLAMALAVVIGLGLTGLAGIARADVDVEVHEHDHSTLLTTNPVGLINGRVNLSVEGAFSPAGSVVVGINFIVMEPTYGNPGGDYFAVGPELGLRFYLIGDAPAGLYLGPYLDLAYLTRDGTEDFGWALGGQAGFNLVLGPFVMGFGAGLGYQTMVLDLTGDDTPDTVGVEGLDLRFRVALGFAF